MCNNPCKHTASCNQSDYSNWPFDSQQCQFEYMSRTWNDSQVILTMSKVAVDDDYGFESDDWALTLTSANVGKKSYVFDDHVSFNNYVTYQFIIERHHQGIVMQVIIPAVVLIVMNLLVLLLSPETPDRIALLVVNLLSHMLYLKQLYYM